MSCAYYGSEFRAARRTKFGTMLVQAGVAATIGLASAVSGAAVALHLAATPAAGAHISRAGGAAALAPTPTDKPKVVTGAPSTAQASTSEHPAAGPEPAVASPPAPTAAAAAPPLSERELTFAWGYAQRHPGASSRQAEARVVPALGGAWAQAGPTAPHMEQRRPPQRYRGAAARRESAGLAASSLFSSLDGERHQALGYAAERRAYEPPIASRAQSPSGTHQRNPFHSWQP